MTDNKIGKNIRRLRKAHGLTQLQLAKKINLTRQALSNYERGKRLPDIYELMVIADTLHVTVDEIMGRNSF